MSENPEINEAEPTSDIPPKRGRGRPRKTNVDISENPKIDATESTSNVLLKRGRCRPRKNVELSENPEINATESTSDILPKRGRGRPRKKHVRISENAAKPTSDILPKRGRGRPRKTQVEMNEEPDIYEVEHPDKDAAKLTSDIPPKRGRGRPRKTQVEMNEEPDIYEVEHPDKDAAKLTSDIPPKRGRGRPPKSKKNRKKPPLLLIIKKQSGGPARARKDELISQRRKNKLTTNIKLQKLNKKSRTNRIAKTCAVSTCMYVGKKRTFHALPNDSRRSVWMYLAGITTLFTKLTYICGIHFNKRDYVTPELRRKLRYNAVPSKHLPSQEHQLRNKDIYNDLTINPSEITLKLHNTINIIDNFKKKHNEKYTDLIMTVYMKNSCAYEMLEKPLGLPSPSQLKKETFNSPINFTRFSNLINKKILTMEERDKACFVTCVQLAVEPKVFYCPKSDKLIGLYLWGNKLADSIKILIAHGVNSEWYLPLDILYSIKHNTKNWIEQTLKAYSMLKVKGLILFPTHARLFADLQTLKLDIKYRRSFIFFDLQLILKLLYFNFKSNNYCFGEFNAKWDDLKELYALDCKRTYPLAPNLSASNVNLTTFDQLTYEHVKEVFSEDTAAALRVYTKAALINAEGTAVFVENISLLIKLFDSNVKLTNEEKESIIQKVKEFLKSINNDQVTHFVDTFVIIMDIYREDHELFSKISKYLLNNYIHKLVDNILNNCIDENPTSLDVENAFRRSLIENLLKPTKKNLSFYEALNMAEWELTKAAVCLKTNEHNKLLIKPSDCRLYMIEREDRILYVAGYILKKCLLYHNTCNILKNYIDTYTEDDKLLSKSIQKDIEKGYCSILKNEFVEFIEVLEMVFLSQFIKFTIKDSLIKLFLKSSELQAIKFTSACPCFPSSYAKELFLRIRLDYLLTFTNMNYDDNNAKSKMLQNISL